MSNSLKLKTILSAHLHIPVDQLSDSLSQDDVDTWDSITMVNLIAEIEETFTISFDITDILSFKNVGLITSIVRENGIDV